MDMLTDSLAGFWDLIVSTFHWVLGVSPLVAITVLMLVFFFIIYTKINPGETFAAIIILSMVWVAAMPTGFLSMREAVSQPGLGKKATCLISLTQDVDYWISRSAPSSAKGCRNDKEDETNELEKQIEEAQNNPKDGSIPIPGAEKGIDRANELKEQDNQRSEDAEKAEKPKE
jgi:hypothetical protein